MKRFLSTLLAIVMIFTAVPLTAFAAKNVHDSDASTETYAKGTNSMGNVLAGKIEEAKAEAEQEASANVKISKLMFAESNARVKFKTDRESKLVVAVYSDDGTKMIASKIQDVTEEETSVVISFEDETLPNDFLVKAFLLDAETNAALCDSVSYDLDIKQIRIY